MEHGERYGFLFLEEGVKKRSCQVFCRSASRLCGRNLVEKRIWDDGNNLSKNVRPPVATAYLAGSLRS